jgi:peptide/nickel transport system ATP-binding protein
MTGKHHLLEVENLSVEFDTNRGVVPAVKNVSWYLDRGETLAILGESGSGKSVSASAVMGLIDSPPGFITSGSILLEGRDILKMSEPERLDINGRRIAMIFQDTLAALNPVYPVGWQIAEAFRAHGVSPAEAREKSIELLRKVGIPGYETRFADYPHQFSGGQRQRIMIAMAIAMSPDLLLADEPTSALDATVQASILKLLKDLQSETGMGMLLITHDLGVVVEVADRVAVMQAGQIVETGTVQEVFGNPEHPYTRKLLDAVPGHNPFSSKVERGDKILISVNNLAKHHAISTGVFSRATGAVVKALDGVTFDLRRGETLGIVGESGSGKSTLARALLGIEQPTSGSAEFYGKPMFGVSQDEVRMRSRNIQAVFQDPTASLNPRLTIAEIIGEPWDIHPDILPKAERPKRIKMLLEQVGLSGSHATRYPHQFSGGQRQRIAIARALAIVPDLIICDEAVSALDVSIQAQVIDLLRSLKEQYGLSYIFITHDLAVVKDFADRIIVMRNGKIIEQGPTEQIFSAPVEAYTRELLAARPILSLEHRAHRVPS